MSLDFALGHTGSSVNGVHYSCLLEQQAAAVRAALLKLSPEYTGARLPLCIGEVLLPLLALSNPATPSGSTSVALHTLLRHLPVSASPHQTMLEVTTPTSLHTHFGGYNHFRDPPCHVHQVGWPTGGHPEATPANAQAFMQNTVMKTNLNIYFFEAKPFPSPFSTLWPRCILNLQPSPEYLSAPIVIRQPCVKPGFWAIFCSFLHITFAGCRFTPH